MKAPDDIDAILKHLGRGIAFVVDHADEYLKRRAMYDGTHGEFYSTGELRKILESTNQAHPMSFAHIPVDALVDKVELANLTSDDSRAAAVLAVWYDANDVDDEVDDWVKKACYFGDYYAVTDPREEDALGRAQDVRTVGASPLSTVVIYDEADGRTPLYGVRYWSVGAKDKKTWKATIFYDDATVFLTTRRNIQTPRADRFEFDDEDGEPIVKHLGGKMLIAHFAVDGKPYGAPVHAKAFGPQDAITKISAINLASADARGFPSRWALADPTAEIDDDIDDDFGDNGLAVPPVPGDGQTTATTGVSKVRTVPGAIAILRGMKQVGSFDAGTSDDSLKNLDWYMRAMAVATGTPLFEFDMKGDQPSGESRRRASARLNNHARKVQRAIGRTLTYIADTVLGVQNLAAPVEVNWYPTEVDNDKDGIELVGAKVKAGIPVVKALSEAGYPDELIAEWYPEGEPHVTPDLLVLFSQALQALGTAETLGAISPEDAQRMLPTILSAVVVPEGPAPLTAVAPVELPIVTKLPA